MQRDKVDVASLFASLDMLVLEATDDVRFRCSVAPPDWAARLIPEIAVSARSLDVGAALPFVDCFLEDARAHWRFGTEDALLSGEFIEELAGGECIALQARALRHAGSDVLVIERLGERYERCVEAHQTARNTLLTRDYMENEIRRVTARIREREVEISIRLLNVTGIRDVETGEHVRRIGLYSDAIATALGHEAQAVIDIRIAAPMHDIGKVGIPDNILLKPGKLTDAEFAVMQQHARMGADMLAGSDIPLLEMAREIALSHHERWDGHGYPQQLAGTDIPESARIVSVCDVYDALMHERVYKRAFTEEETLDLMRGERGKHFDPDILDCFLDLQPAIRAVRESVIDTTLETDVAEIGRLTGTRG